MSPAEHTPTPSTALPAAQVWADPLPPVAGDGLAFPRIGIAGIGIESSTVSVHLSDWEAFTVRRGAELRAHYPFLNIGTELGEAAEWLPLTHARSLPGGAVQTEVYTSLRDEITEQIRTQIDEQGPFDGFFLDIHGAMSVVGMTDAEGDLATAVREALGPDCLISTGMDLHGNVSAELSTALDLLTCYRMAPHEDAPNTKYRAVRNLLARLRGPGGADPVARRPWQAWVQVPVLLPGEKTSTRLEPARSLYQRVPEVEAMPGILDAAIWIGYAWADEPRCQGAVVVTGDDAALAGQQAGELAREFWRVRNEFTFVTTALPWADCLNTALNQDPGALRPFVISDSGDNPTAGGTGDVTWTLRQLLADERLRHEGAGVIHASIFDADAVAEAVAAGVGGQVDLRVGAGVDDTASGPAHLIGQVHSITYGDPVGGTIVVLRAGGVHAIVTERRKPFHKVRDFTDLDLDPHTADVLIVKIGYLQPELYELAGNWLLALTPGGVDQDLQRLGHHRIERPMFPFDPQMADPDLTPVLRRRGEET